MEKVLDAVGLIFQGFHDSGDFFFECFDRWGAGIFELVIFQVTPHLFIGIELGSVVRLHDQVDFMGLLGGQIRF